MASHLVTLRIVARDYAVPLSWDLVQWCYKHGADEWTVRRAQRPYPGSPFELFEADMQPFRHDQVLRPHLTTSAKEPRVRRTDLWECSSESLKILKRFLPAGLFTFAAVLGDPTACVEDPIFYRRGQIMLGIVSHEQEGVLHVTRAERRDLEKASDFPVHEARQSIGY